MKKVFALLLVILLVSSAYAQSIYKRSLKLMGSRFEITVVANDSTQAKIFINAAVSEISRIEKLISSWDENSQTSEINRCAGVNPVKVNPELFKLIERSIAISKLTEGAFDISFASIDKIWKFDGSMTQLPTPEEIKESVSRIGYKNIELNHDSSSVFLRIKGMKIGFGAIGKGYAADKAKTLLLEQGVDDGIINASGDITAWGTQPNGEKWKVAITNPLDKHKAYAILPITNGAVVTSGDYEKFVTLNDKRYSHIIDPRTGYPTSGIVSVTVFASKAELADALATSVFVLGTQVGLNLINQLPNVECVVIDEKGEIYTTENIKIESL